MLATLPRNLDKLDTDHPCFDCAVRNASVCRVLGCDELRTYKNLGWTLTLRPGQTLFHEGDPATRVFNLTRGTLKLYKLLPDGRRQVTGFMFPGDFLGITLDDEHAFTVEALEEAQLCWFPRTRFGEFLEQHFHLERALFRVAAHELAAAQLQMVLLGRKSAIERVASFFMNLLERSERVAGEKVGVIDLPMSRLDIADYLGLTKETVSRVLATLKDRKLVRLLTLDRIQLLDRHGLTEMAEGHCEA